MATFLRNYGYELTISLYSVFGFKSIGYVRLFPSPEITTTTTTSHSQSAIRSRNAQSTNGKAKAVDDAAGGYTRAVAVILGVLALAAAFAVPLLARTSSRAWYPRYIHTVLWTMDYRCYTHYILWQQAGLTRSSKCVWRFYRLGTVL